MAANQYSIDTRQVKPPPTSFIGKLKHLGPGFILSASIVGSGELIATTTLGATAGFAAFWIIIISCLVKVTVQLEFGKHTIVTGETAMQAFSNLPGPRIGKGKWSVWTILFLIIFKVIQLGGMTGSTAIVLNMLFPQVPISVWVFVAAFITSILIYSGRYGVIEKISLFMIGMFTILTIVAVLSLRYTEFAFSFADVLNSQQFQLSGAIVTVAIGAFGITGVASDEIIAYNYWCLEKGYAAFTGPHQDTPEWRTRAKGWIRVMYLDAFLAMLIYTAVTAAFYLLGAAILHDKGVVPQGNDLIETVAMIYTESLGRGYRTMYLVGAFFVLYSSLFATLAAWTRIYTDIFNQVGWTDFSNVSQRKKIIAILAWVFPVIWALLYLFIELPVIMILFGGLVGSILLFLIVFAAINFRYNRQQLIPPSIAYDVCLWISIISIFGVAIYGIIKVLL